MMESRGALLMMILTLLLVIFISPSSSRSPCSSSSSSSSGITRDRGDSPCTKDVEERKEWSEGPSIESIETSSYILDVTIFSSSKSDLTKHYKFEATIFDFEFDRDVYVETFNGSYSYSNVSDTYFSPNTEMMKISCNEFDNDDGDDDDQVVSRKTRLNDPHLEADWRVVPETQSTENWIHSTIFEVRKNTRPKRSSHQIFSVSVLESVEYDNRVLRNPHMSEKKNCTLLCPRVRTFITLVRNTLEHHIGTIRFLSSSEQRSWPVYNIVDRTAQTVPMYVQHHIFDTDVSKMVHKILITDRNLVNAVPLRKRAAIAHRNFEHFYPSVSTSWNPTLPPMPNFCGLEDGSLSVQDAMKLRIHHELSFIEMKTKDSVSGIPLLGDILEFVMKLILPPIFNPFIGRLVDHLLNKLGSTMSDQAGSEVPFDVVKKLAPKLRYNLVNLIPDLLAARLTRTLTSDLTMEIGPDVLARVSSDLVDSLHRDLAEELTQSVSSKISKVLPYLLERSLPISLTTQLTRSVTHSLVPTVSYALARMSPEQSEICNECYLKGTRCSLCHDSAVSQYYLGYYSTYYSDYFSEYYQEYYSNSLRELDRVQHPRKDSDEKPRDAEASKRARSRNRGLDSGKKGDFEKPLRWDRPMSGSGRGVN